jgi:acylphosphatase
MKKMMRVTYSGSVQGVGFRFTAERIAASLGVNGRIKNLSDGRVEMVCEGALPALNSMLERLGSIFRANIRDHEVEWSSATGRFVGFEIMLD